jgi:two-component system OmpR family response regulator
MRVLVAEDGAALRSQLTEVLSAAGYTVDAVADGKEAGFLGAEEPFDAIVLDLGLPGKDGLSVLRGWRAAGRLTPVLILTARGAWQEKVEGIDAGADDYLAKPFRMEELLARLRAIIRRGGGHAATTLACGPVALDTRTARVTVHGRPITLTAHEYKVLTYLMHHAGRVVSQTELTEHVYAQDFDRDSNIIEVFISRLRRKLGVAVIHTERGLGYRLEAW